MVKRRARLIWLMAGLLLAAYTLALPGLVSKAPTFDEQSYLVRGLGYLRGENRHMRVGHPLGLNALNAMLLVNDAAVRLPSDDPSWQATSFHRPAELFLWEIGNDVAHIMVLGRLPTLWLLLLLAALTGRWAGQMSRRRGAGALALALLAFDPNMLAHGRLTTTDLGLAAGAVLAGYLLWRFLRRPGWSTAAAAGVGFGLLQNTKFTAGLFVPLFGLVLFVGLVDFGRRPAAAGQGRWRGYLLPLLLAFPAAAFFTLWGSYAFQIGTLPENLPTLPGFSGLTLPLAHHLEQLLDIGGRVQRGANAFLLGSYSDSGWWYYFPVALAVKTPLPTLLILIWAGGRWLRRRGRLTGARSLVDSAMLLIPALGYFAIALTSDINIGYRHLLPLLPFLFVFAAVTLANLLPDWPRPAGLGWLPLVLAGWLLLNTLFIAPHFLAFFNQLAGGPDNGWRVLVDSNLDWGQDLSGLAAWLEEHGYDHVWLSYFGEARPDYYGIDYTGLASYPPRLMDPAARPFAPGAPAPGLYAISATNLQGVLFENHDLLGYFRERTPLARIGYSIFLFAVPATGAPADLLLGGIQPDEIAAADYAQIGSNDVTMHWFDPGQAWLWPPAGDRPLWLALSNQVELADQTSLNDYFVPIAAAADYQLYRAALQPPGAVGAPVVFQSGSGMVELFRPENSRFSAADNLSWDLTLTWRQVGPPQPVKIFVHLVDSDGEIVSQWDGLGVPWSGWRTGDTLQQQVRLPLPPPATYDVWVGLYHPQSGQRWLTPTGDRIKIGQFIQE